jgi:hypothetical protein
MMIIIIIIIITIIIIKFMHIRKFMIAIVIKRIIITLTGNLGRDVRMRREPMVPGIMKGSDFGEPFEVLFAVL